MATPSALMNSGLGHVLVEFSYQYEGRDGALVQIRPNERYELLSKTNTHWWQVRSGPSEKPFYIPAKYVRELPQVPGLFLDPIGPENTPGTSPAHTPAPCPTPLPVPVPTPPKPQEDPRKPSDQVTIRLRPEGQRKAENRMSTFGVPLDLDLPGTTNMASKTTGSAGTTNMAAKTTGSSGTTNMAAGRTTGSSGTTKMAAKTTGSSGTTNMAAKTTGISGTTNMAAKTTGSSGTTNMAAGTTNGSVTTNMPTSRTTNGCGTTNMSDSPRAPTPGDSGKSPAPLRHQPIPVEIPRAPPTQDTAPKKGKQEVQEEATTKQGQQKVTSEGQQEVSVEEAEFRLEEEPSESEEEERESSHIYESIQELQLDLSALIGPDRTHKQEVESEAPSPAQVSGLCPIYANVSKPIPPPPSEPAPVAPGPAHQVTDSAHHAAGSASSVSGPTHSISGSSSSGLSPASPLSPLDGWQTHTDSDSGKLYYFNPLTRQSTWTPHPDPPTQSGEWERLVDEVSGRFYFFNPKTGATSWALPEPQPPSTSRPVLPEEDYPPDDSVFSANPQLLIPRAQLENTPEPEDMPPQRLYPVRRHASDLTDRAQGHAPDSSQGHLLEKAGILNKTKVCENGKKIRKNWSQSWTVLHGGILTFHRDPKSAPTGTNSKASQIVPEFTVDLKGASVHWVQNKSSKKNVIELRTRLGCEILMQYDTESIISDWFKVVHDTIRQLDCDHMSEDSDDSDKDEKDRKRISSRSGSGAESEQRQVRNKLRRFLQRRPTLQSVKEKGYIRDAVFGCHLDVLCYRENVPVPRFVERCVRFVERRGLDTDGIYRVSGNLAVIQRLRHRADQEEELCMEEAVEVHVVTGALKLFFRELPEPLFPFSSYDRFIAAIQLGEYSQRVEYIKDLVQTLPMPNHSTMELLFRHLRRVVEHKDQNRMSVQSLAIVFGPTLLRPQTESNLTVHMVFQSQIVELVLTEFTAIFGKSPQH